MNYKRIHDELIHYCKTTEPRERILKRDPSDIRLSDNVIYVEKHHICPKHMGGSDNDDNLVKLLPEEHMLVHMLRYKTYHYYDDMLAVIYTVYGKSVKEEKKKYADGKIPILLNKGIKKAVVFIKEQSKHLKKNGGRRMASGKVFVGPSKGKTLVVDAITGEKVGLVPVDDPKFLSGEYVHFSKGRIGVRTLDGERVHISTEEYHKNKDKYYRDWSNNQGLSSPVSFNITEDEILDKYEEFCRKIGFITTCRMLWLFNRGVIPCFNEGNFRFDGKGKDYVQELICERLKGELPVLINIPRFMVYGIDGVGHIKVQDYIKNILSGEYVLKETVSNGFIHEFHIHCTSLGIDIKVSANTRNFNITDNEILDIYEEFCKKVGIIISYGALVKFSGGVVPNIGKAYNNFVGKSVSDVVDMVRKRLPNLPYFPNGNISATDKEKYTNGLSLNEYIENILQKE